MGEGGAEDVDGSEIDRPGRVTGRLECTKRSQRSYHEF